MKRDKAESGSLDRALIGRLIEREIPRHRDVRTVQGLADATRVSRSTIYRAIRDEDPKVGAHTFARLEAGLGLPSDALITAGAHDLDGMVEIGCPADLVAWVRKEMAKKQDLGGQDLRKSV
jgi:hypothetical protein